MPRSLPCASIRLPSETGVPGGKLAHVESDHELRVTLAGDRSGDYVIVEEREDGSLVLAPDTSMAAIRRRHGLVPATLAEFEADYGPVQPPDGEGGSGSRAGRRPPGTARVHRRSWISRLLPEQLAKLGDHA